MSDEMSDFDRAQWEFFQRRMLEEMSDFDRADWEFLRQRWGEVEAETR